MLNEVNIQHSIVISNGKNEEYLQQCTPLKMNDKVSAEIYNYIDT